MAGPLERALGWLEGVGQRQLTAAQQSRVMPQQTEQSNGVLLLRTLGGCANGLCWPSFAQLDDQQCLVPSGHLVS